MARCSRIENVQTLMIHVKKLLGRLNYSAFYRAVVKRVAIMTKTKMLIQKAKDQNLQIKEITIKLLNEPMAEDQKEMVLQLYRLVK